MPRGWATSETKTVRLSIAIHEDSIKISLSFSFMVTIKVLKGDDNKEQETNTKDIRCRLHRQQ